MDWGKSKLNIEETKYADYINKRKKYWETLRKIREEYSEAKGNQRFEGTEFELFMEETYGIRLVYYEGNIAGTYDIVDEQKHLIYLLKFT
jgi:hypothetical protein